MRATKMFKKISVLVPTRMRLERLSTLLASFEETVPNKNAELVFRVDEDDKWSQNFLVGHPVVIGPRGKGYGDMPKFYNEMVAIASGNVIMCGNDDMVFRTFDWPTLLLEVANRYPDGLFNLGSSTHNQTHYPFSTVSRSVVETLGFLWDPRIFWGDMYLRDVMAHFGRCVMVPEVRIDHDWAGHNPDPIYKETLPHKRVVEKDKSYWTGPHAIAVKDAIERLQGVLA